MTSERTGEDLSVMITIPFYANLGYLREALDSLVAQTDEHWTAVVVDDGSPEHGAEELVVALGDGRVSYSRNVANLGVAGNFNRCFDLAAAAGADVVTIFHADDLLEPAYVATIRRTHAERPESVCVAPRATVIDALGRPTRTLADLVKSLLWPSPRRAPVLEGEDGLVRLLRGQFFYCPAVSYRMALLPDLRWDERWRQVMDLDLYGRILLEGGSIALVEDRVYRYRRHGQTTTEVNSTSSVRTAEEHLVLDTLGGAARRRGWHRAARVARSRVIVRLQSAVRSVRGGRRTRRADGPADRYR